MIKRVLLFHPRTFHERNYSQFWLPYSLLSIASQVDRERYTIEIVDNNLEKADDLEQFRPAIEAADLVGISTMLGKQVRESLLFARLVRQCGSAPIVVGGPAAIMAPDLMFDSGKFDYVVSGQGELSFPLLLDYLSTGQPPCPDIPNLHFSSGGKSAYSFKKAPIARREFKPFDFSLIRVERYLARDAKIGDRVINYVSSQGCGWKCGFCSDTSLYSNRWVTEQVSSVVRTLKYLQATFGIDGVKFYDSNFAVQKNRVVEFCSELEKQQLSINWASSIHPRTLLALSDDELRLVRQSHCRRLLIGAESGDDRVLALVRKGLRVKDTRTLAGRLAAMGLCASYTFVVGFPDIPDDHYRATFELAEELLGLYPENEVKVHFYTPFPHTPLAERAIAHGWKFPTTIEEWADIDYYGINVEWIPEMHRARVRELNVRGCPSVTA